MINIEWKAPLLDRTIAEERLGQLGAELSESLVQIDTYFRVPHGRLKLREGLRQGELIRYNRAEHEPVRRSEYERVPVGDVRSMLGILERALGIVGRVEKHRGVWMLGDVRIHIDRVVGLGDFIEVEVPSHTEDDLEARAKAERILASLDLTPDDCISASYIDLVRGDTPWTS